MPFSLGVLNEVSLIFAIDGEGCHEESKLGHWGLAIWIPLAIYLMIGQFVICEEYFVPILSQLGDRWKMTEDVQGATLLAVGSSSPELFTAVLGALLMPDDNPGPGTNVGSAVFNMCIIVGLSAIFAPRVVKLSLVPFLRDSICYMIGLIELFIFYSVTSPGVMEIWEAIALVAWWVIYVVVVLRTDLMAVRCCCCIPDSDLNKSVSDIEMDAVDKLTKGGIDDGYVALGQHAADNDGLLIRQSSYNRTKSVLKVDDGKRGVLYDARGHAVADFEQNPDNIRIAASNIAANLIDAELQHLLDELNRKQRQNINRGWVVCVVPTHNVGGAAAAPPPVNGGYAHGQANGYGYDHGHGNALDAPRPQHHLSAYVRRRTLMETIHHEQRAQRTSRIPERGAHAHGADQHAEEEQHGHGNSLLHKVLIPWVKIFHMTLPKPDGEWASKHIFATIGLIVLWLGILTFFVVDASTKIGQCFFIPADLLGVTLLAVGSSLPDCISSVIVARQMKLDAAVANAFGSNIFDANLSVGFAFVLSSVTALINGESSAISLGDEHAVHTFMQLIVCAALFLVVLWLMMWCTIFRLERWMGYVLIVMYVAFVVVFTMLFTQDEDIVRFEVAEIAEGADIVSTIFPL